MYLWSVAHQTMFSCVRAVCVFPTKPNPFPIQEPVKHRQVPLVQGTPKAHKHKHFMGISLPFGLHLCVLGALLVSGSNRGKG